MIKHDLLGLEVLAAKYEGVQKGQRVEGNNKLRLSLFDMKHDIY